MAIFKAICTVTWKFDCDDDIGKGLEYAKEQIERILDTDPYGAEFEGFSVQVDLVKPKQKKQLVHVGQFGVDEVLDHITTNESKRSYSVQGETYEVKMNSDRYHLFKANRRCVSCGLLGTKMLLDLNPGDRSPHFNLYGEEKGRLILMTKDHKLAKSKGGSDTIANLQTMCSVCNGLKGSHDLTIENCRELRQIHDNMAKLPRKELRDLLNRKRDEMASNNAIKETS